MIISHKHKFIFLKPTKCASTSVEINLARNTGSKDIVTGVSKYDPKSDKNAYEDLSKNNNGFYNHMKPKEILEKIPQKTWDEYTKITIVRNPWDLVVSRYYWEKKTFTKKKFGIKPILRNLFNPNAYKYFFRFYKAQKATNKDDFEEFIENFLPAWKNTDFYFLDGKFFPDIVLRFEHLEEDYKKACKKIGIPYQKLPLLKTKQRPKTDYKKKHTPKTKKLVKKMFKKEIDYFNYSF